MALAQVAMNGGKVGSIGAAWPPAFDANNARVKGFCPTIIRSRNGLHNAAFSHAHRATKAHPKATRTTFRAFVGRGLVETIASPGFSIEAVIPADNAVPGFDLVYFGNNHATRTPLEETRRQEIENVERIRQEVARVAPQVAIARLASKGYRVSMPINGELHNGRDIEALLRLYQEAYQHYTFPINGTTIQAMTGNGNRAVVARDASGQIASALIAEECEIRLGNGSSVMLYELSDFATFRKDRGNGLMTALQLEAVKLIRGLPGGEKAIIYAEDRAPWSAVNKSSQQAGMSFAGTLPWHCSIQSDRNVQYAGEHESLNVWYAK